MKQETEDEFGLKKKTVFTKAKAPIIINDIKPKQNEVDIF